MSNENKVKYITLSIIIPQANMHIILINVKHMLIAPFIAKSIDLVDEYCKFRVLFESWLILLTENAHNSPLKMKVINISVHVNTIVKFNVRVHQLLSINHNPSKKKKEKKIDRTVLM